MYRQLFAHKLLVLLALALMLGLSVHPALAQTQVISPSAVHLFGEQITFRATLQAPASVASAVIFFQARGDTHTTVGQAEVALQEEDTYVLTYTHHLSDYWLPAFANIDYRFEVRLDNGDTYSSPTYWFYYDDNRFEWQSLQEEPFQVHWYDGDMAFAQSVLDVAQEGLQYLQSRLPLPAPSKLDIYLYADHQSMQDALSPYSQDWVAGHADPRLGVVMVTLPPGADQYLLTQQRIPHELMHILLYQATNLGYENLPTWLNEGLASMVELYPNPDYSLLVKDAAENETLLPMSTLCETFPRDASSALLSYAQSASFTRYIYNTYGTSGLQKLISDYANGLDCESGAKSALGVGLTQLERHWQRDDLYQNVALTALKNLLPWLILLTAALAAPLVLILRWARRKG